MDTIELLFVLNKLGIKFYVEDGKLKSLSNGAKIPDMYVELIKNNKERIIEILQSPDNNPELSSGYQVAYWQQQLKDLPLVHSLPLNYSRPGVLKQEKNRFSLSLGGDLYRALVDLCRHQDVTIFIGIYAAFSVLLSRYSNEKDIVVGNPISSGRYLVLRSDLSGNPDFFEALERTRNTVLKAYEHQQVLFTHLVEQLQPEFTASHNPLFQIQLSYENKKAASTLVQSSSEAAGPVIDLGVNVIESDEGIDITWDYNISLFNGASIERMAHHFNELLSALLDAPKENVFSVNMLTEAEQRQLIVQWNDTQADYPLDMCIHEFIEAQAISNPDAVAVNAGGKKLTFHALNEKSNQLAHYLITEKNVQPETLVGVCMSRSLDMVIGIVGILKAGGAYVPLDPEYPFARMAYLLDDAKLETIVTQRQIQKKFDFPDSSAVCMDCDVFQQQVENKPTHNVDKSLSAVTARNLVYVIYTSGSTGNPKGVMVEHKNLVNYLYAIRKYIDNTNGSYVNTNICFDGTATSFWPPLVFGGCLTLSANPDVESLDSILNEVERDEPKLFKITPSHLEALSIRSTVIEKAVGHSVFVGGDIFLSQMYKKLPAFVKRNNIFNHYGPSEGTVGCTVYPISNEFTVTGNSVPLGRPLGNVKLYVMNEKGKINPIGVPGELYIGGEGVARGYLNRPELTAEKFIEDPFASDSQLQDRKKLYKTGDMVRWLESGDLEFLGRIDNQVKIRGYRIELGEIENQLNKSSEINSAVVIALEDGVGLKQLAAYVTIKDLFGEATSKLSPEKLTEHLKAELGAALPEYMIPARIVFLNEFPLNANGKVDRKQLATIRETTLRECRRAPETDVEKYMAGFWAELLDISVESVGLDSDFFELGGHSIIALRLIAKTNATFNIKLALMDIFEHRKLSQFSAIVETTKINNGHDALQAKTNAG